MYESYDANTGLKIEEQNVDTLSQSAVKEAEKVTAADVQKAKENEAKEKEEKQKEAKEKDAK